MQGRPKHFLSTFGLLILCGSLHAGQNCVSVSAEVYKYSSLRSKVEAKGWKIKRNDDRSCVATHSVAFSIADRVDFGGGFQGYFGAISFVNLSQLETPFIATVSGPDRDYVLNTLIDGFVRQLSK